MAKIASLTRTIAVEAAGRSCRRLRITEIDKTPTVEYLMVSSWSNGGERRDKPQQRASWRGFLIHITIETLNETDGTSGPKDRTSRIHTTEKRRGNRDGMKARKGREQVGG